MKNRLKSAIIVLAVFIILVVSAYINTYYRATEETVEAVEKAYKIDGSTLVFEPQNEVECGIIFYPGGKVEYTAYAPLMQACAEEGILCVLTKMPCNLAVLDIKAAEGIPELFPGVKDWYMAGHSLGGSMAATYIGENTEEFKGLILLAAYSTEDLSATELDVLSIYGTEDKVLNEIKYIKYNENFPEDYVEQVIEGGCHAWFGNYGEQEGDGEAEITSEEQQNLTVEAIISFIQ